MSNEKSSPACRSILHLDMDAFYAAVEEIDNPALRGKPVIVGGTPEGRGVVSTANYEARKYGVHSAMPAATAVRLCPRGVFLPVRMSRYVEMSRRVFGLMGEYTPLVEPLSIDEAFLDVTGCRPAGVSGAAGGDKTTRDRRSLAEAIARQLQQRVRDETGGLTCSVGVAHNKFLAKLASDLEKPGGFVSVPIRGVEQFLAPLPVERLWGVGPKAAARLRALGLKRIGNLQRLSARDFERLLGGEMGRHLARLCVGKDDRRVEPHADAKSVSQEVTYGEFIPSSDVERLRKEIFALSDRVAFRLRRSGLWGRTVTLKVRDERFRTMTRSISLASATCWVEEIHAAAWLLFDERTDLQARSVRLLGVGVSGLQRESRRQLDLFAGEDWKKAARIARTTDAIREKLGDRAIMRGRLLE